MDNNINVENFELVELLKKASDIIDMHTKQINKIADITQNLSIAIINIKSEIDLLKKRQNADNI